MTGDRRVVTVLFTDVSGFTSMSEKLDPGKVTEIVNQFFGVLTEPIYRYGGVVDKYIGDAIMAIFGAPVAHEDDPERAVRAACEMQLAATAFALRLQEQTGISLRVRIGLHTGLVVTGEMGSAQKRNYTVMGETVNLAQKMESLARPGKILVTAQTHHHTSHCIEYLPLDPVGIKGKTGLIPVYEVIAPLAKTSSQQDSLRFVGRSFELAKLKLCAEAALGGSPQLVKLLGEAGIGKSRLSNELLCSIDPEAHVEAFRIRAASYEQGTTYAFVGELIHRWLRIKDRTTPESIRALLGARLESSLSLPKDQLERMADAIASLVGLDSTKEAIDQLSPQQRRAFAFRSLNMALLQGGKCAPLLLNFEDLHWADEASLEWIQSLLEMLATREFQASPVMVICQARPVEGNPLSEWRTSIDSRTIVLRPLNEPESWELFTLLLELPTERSRWSEAVLRLAYQALSRAEGNPLFLCELVRSLTDSGVLLKDEFGSWSVQETTKSTLPPTVNGVLASRIDRLPSDLRSVLQIASIAGRTFQPQLIAHVGHFEDLDETLSHLAKAEFLQSRSTGEWQFQQALTHEVVYNSLLLATRKDLHRKVGEELEAALGDRKEEAPQLLARHFKLAELPSRALYYLFRSGQMAYRNFSNQEAISCFTDCVTILKSGEVESLNMQLEEVLLALADVQTTTGQYEAAAHHLKEALQLQTSKGERAETLRRLGGVSNLQGDYRAAMERYDQGLELLKSAPHPLTQARILLDQGLSLFRQGQYADVIALCERSLAALAGTPHIKEIAMAQSILGLVAYRQHALPEAETYHQRSLELREQIQDLFGVASSLNNLGVVYLEQGEWAKSADHYERSLFIYRQIGDLSRQIIQLNNLGDLQRNRGDFSEARQCYERVYELSCQTNDPYGQGYGEAGLGMVMLDAGEPAEAIAHLQAGIQHMKAINHMEVLPEPLSSLGHALILQGCLQDAEVALEEALVLARAHDSLPQIGLVLGVKARLLARQLEFDRAREVIAEAIAALGEGGALIEVARAYAIQAEILQGLGDITAAQSRRDEARLIFERLGAKHDLARLVAR